MGTGAPRKDRARARRGGNPTPRPSFRCRSASGGATFLTPVAICKSETSFDQFSGGCGSGPDSAARQLRPAQAWSRVRIAESFPR